MRREDIETMRNAHGVVRSAAVGASSANAVSPNDRRIALVFTGPSEGSITISTEPDVSLGRGLVLTPGMELQLTVERHGDAVKKPWYAIAEGGASLLGYLEVTFDG